MYRRLGWRTVTLALLFAVCPGAAPAQPVAGVLGIAEEVAPVEKRLIVTDEVFVTGVSRREELRKSLGASAVEMEGGAFVQACRQFGVPCLVVRSITDRADLVAPSSYREFLAVSSENAAAVVAAAIARLGARSR